MTATLATGLDAMWRELLEMANAQYDSAPCRRLLSVPLSLARGQCWAIQSTYFTSNRRDCWAYVQGKAPMDVKRIIWAHEAEELMGEEGKPDHHTLAIQQGALLNLTAEDFDQTPPTDGVQTCLDAWTLLARESPWLEGFAASAVLEIRNSEEYLRGGCMSRLRGEKWERELGIPFKKQVNNAEHVIADVQHAHLLMDVARQHALSAEAQQSILRGAQRSLAIDRVLWGHLAEAMEAL